MAWFNKHKKDNQDNRLNFILGIIFLLTLALIGKLFAVQIKNHDYYVSAAAGQHEMFAEIEPERGKIFIQDQEALYPIATNKTYVQIYAIPKEIKDAQRLAETLYTFFHEPQLAEEADKILKEQDTQKLADDLAYVQNMGLSETELKAKEAEVQTNHKLLMTDPTYLELRTLKREQILKNRQADIIKEYLDKMDKWNDPYESLQKKVEPELAKQFHLALLNDNWPQNNTDLNNLEFKNYKIYDKSTDQPMEFAGLGYMTENYRYYLENNIGSHILGFVSHDKEDKNDQYGKHGSYGLEGFFDEELFGQYGSVKGDRGAGGLMIANNLEYDAKTNGDDLVLTIDRSIQFYACNRLDEMAQHYAATSGTVIIMEPQTGAIIAMCSYPDFDPNNYNEVEDVDIYNNPALFDQYEPGSVFKAITMAAALDQNKVTPTSTYNDQGQVMIEGWPKPINNADFSSYGAHGLTTMVGVLENSLNTGAIYAMQQLKPEVFADYVQKFGFGEKTGIELEGEFAGNINNLLAKKIKPIDIAVASFGQGITVTPLQMLTAYAAIANGGYLVKPYLVREILHADGTKLVIQPKKMQQVISTHTSAVLSGMLASVVANGHSKNAQVPGYFVAGKTGTAQIADPNKRGYYESQYNHTFISFAPADQARFVMLVKFENPKGYQYADSTAVPLSRDIMDFILKYWQVPQNTRVD